MKNAGLGFAIPYLHNGQMHDFVPDFIARLATPGEGGKPRHLILETKGYDPLDEVKEAAAPPRIATLGTHPAAAPPRARYA